MRARRLKPLVARAHVAATDALHLANVYVGGMLNWRDPVLPMLPLRCEHIAYTAGQAWLAHIWRAVYAVF